MPKRRFGGRFRKIGGSIHQPTYPHPEQPQEKKRKYRRKKPTMLGKLRVIAKECQGIENGKTIEEITERVFPEITTMSRWHYEVTKNRVRNSIARMRKEKELRGLTVYPFYSVPAIWAGKQTRLYFCPKTSDEWRKVKEQAVIQILPLGRIVKEAQILAKEYAKTEEEKMVAEEMQETILIGQGNKQKTAEEIEKKRKKKKERGA
jgi:hypothetical protein